MNPLPELTGIGDTVAMTPWEPEEEASIVEVDVEEEAEDGVAMAANVQPYGFAMVSKPMRPK